MALNFWIKTAGLFLIRSGRSTLLLTLMVFTAVSVLIFLSALAVGINDAMIRNSVSLFSGHISGFSLPESIRQQDLITKEVVNVLKRAAAPGILSNGNRFETVTLIAIDPEEEKAVTSLWKKTVQGRFPERGQGEIYLSLSVSEALGIGAGEGVFYRKDPDSAPMQLSVSGVYKTGIDRLDRGVAFCPFGAVPIPEETWDAAIFLRSGSRPEDVITHYAAIYPEEKGFKSWAALMPDLKQLIELNYVSMSIVTILVFGVVSVGIACAFAIFILKNLREYGVMKAMGITPAETAGLVFSEVILMNLAASLPGVLAGALAVWIAGKTGIDLSHYTSHNQYFAVSGIIFPRLTAYSLLLPPALALAFSLVSALWPAGIVIRKNSADILRSI